MNKMNNPYIKIADEQMNLDEFLLKVRNYDLELCRDEILSVIEAAEKMSPQDVPTIINTVKETYRINMA